MRILCALVTIWLAVGAAPLAMAGGLHTEEVTYSADGTPLQGYLAYDPSVEGERPGVLVVHEWWGHNDYARERARMLADLGYTALALDMYGEGRTADHPDAAGEMSSKVREDLPLMKRRFDAALERLRGHETTDPDDIAAIGYCFGGGVVLEMARAGTDIDGVVSFHGTLATEQRAGPGDVKTRVLVFTGAADPFVPDEQVDGFRTEMERADADYRVVSFEGVKHSFTNPGADEHGERFDLPLEYDAEADRESWEQTKVFFEEIFGD